jgi:hypothetical protein
MSQGWRESAQVPLGGWFGRAFGRYARGDLRPCARPRRAGARVWPAGPRRGE